jgi:hypothetical protein
LGGWKKSPLSPRAEKTLFIPILDYREELSSRRRLAPEDSPRGRSHDFAARFPDPTHGHAKVLGLDDHGDTLGLEARNQGISDLGGETLLKLGPPRQTIYHAGELAHAHNAAAGNVANVDLAVERQKMVFTERVEGNVLHHHHLFVPFLKANLKQSDWILFQSGEQLGVHSGDTFGSIHEAFAARVFPNSLDYRGDSLFDSFLIHSEYPQALW